MLMIEAVRAMLDLVYNIHLDEEEEEEEEEESENFAAYRKYMFSSKANMCDLRRPKIHLLVKNRVTRKNTRATTAFDAMGTENLKVLYEAYQQHEECFSPLEERITSKEAFKEQYFQDIQDFHSTAIISLHTGCPLGALAGLKGKVKIGEKAVRARKDLLSPYVDSLDKLVQKL